MVTGRLYSIDRYSNDPDDDRYGSEGIRSGELIVEAVYKGPIKKNQKIKVGQGWGADCIFTFDESDLGKSYLFYFFAYDRRHPLLDAEEKPYFDEPVYWTTHCGRSGELRDRSNPANQGDLKFLENLDKYLGRTRIHGRIVSSRRDSGNFAGTAVEIVGENQRWSTVVQSDNSFEIYDVPAGIYEIVVSFADEWIVNAPPHYTLDVDPDDYEAGITGPENRHRVLVRLQPGNHAFTAIFVEQFKGVRGRIIDPGGRPMQGACLKLIDPDTKILSRNSPSCSNANGEFIFTDVSPGQKYLLVANPYGRISGIEPFRTTFYPGVTEKESAKLVSIGPNRTLSGLEIKVPQIEPVVTVSGTIVYSDGKPVTAEWVDFRANDGQSEFAEKQSTGSDESGKFTFRIPKGIKGVVSADKNPWLRYARCEELIRFLNERVKVSDPVETNEIEIDATRDIEGLTLVLPMPSCK